MATALVASTVEWMAASMAVQSVSVMVDLMVAQTDLKMDSHLVAPMVLLRV